MDRSLVPSDLLTESKKNGKERKIFKRQGRNGLTKKYCRRPSKIELKMKSFSPLIQGEADEEVDGVGDRGVGGGVGLCVQGVQVGV